MRLAAGLLEQQQRAGHHELDVVRMRGDGDGQIFAGIGIFGLFSEFHRTGLRGRIGRRQR